MLFEKYYNNPIKMDSESTEILQNEDCYCVKTIKYSGIVWVDNMLERKLTYTKPVQFHI